MFKSIIKMAGISLGCSCAAVQAQAEPNVIRESDAIILTTFAEPESSISAGDMSVVQDIDKIYAL